MKRIGLHRRRLQAVHSEPDRNRDLSVDAPARHSIDERLDVRGIVDVHVDVQPLTVLTALMIRIGAVSDSVP